MSEHSPPAADASAFEGDDFSTPKLVLIAIVSTVLLLVTVLVLQVLYYGYQSDLDQTKVIDVRNAEAESALAQQRARLTRYAWTDQSAGLVTIPIERAMQLVVRDEAARQAAGATNAAETAAAAAPSATSGAVADPAPAAEAAAAAAPTEETSPSLTPEAAPADAASPADEGVPPVGVPAQTPAAAAATTDAAPADVPPADANSSPGSAS